MNVHLEPVTVISSVLVLALVTGCWTPDAHLQGNDAGPVEASNLCGTVSKARCFAFEPLPANGLFMDLSTGSAGTCTPTLGPGGYASTGFWASPGPDKDAGVVNGITLVQLDMNNPNSCHLKGTIPGAASWGEFLNMATTDLCADGTARAGGVDASGYDGLTIRLGGNAGPPGQMTFKVDSVGTPQDPYRQQELQTIINVPPVPTTYSFLWSELTAACGRASDFQPGRIVSIGGSMLALAGIAYEFDVEIDVIGFCHATTGSPIRCAP